MTLMFQLEVAERITAAPATSAYGRLAVLAQWRCRCDLLLRLPPGAFSPPPKVWSAVVGFTPHAEDPPPALFAAMEKLTAAAFGQRRKMLRGALKTLGNAEALLDAAGIAGDRRGETLTVAEFDRLARSLASREPGAAVLDGVAAKVSGRGAGRESAPQPVSRVVLVKVMSCRSRVWWVAGQSKPWLMASHSLVDRLATKAKQVSRLGEIL
jgi:hypothetical protein